VKRERLHPLIADGAVSGGANSGHEAVSLAYHLGAAEIVLIGFDMRATRGINHYHGNHGRRLTNPNRNLYKKWIRHMKALVDDIRSRGVVVKNETPSSALKI